MVLSVPIPKESNIEVLGGGDEFLDRFLSFHILKKNMSKIVPIILIVVFFIFIYYLFDFSFLPKSCPEGLIPERVQLIHPSDMGPLSSYDDFGKGPGSRWANGTLMPWLHCVKGNLKGQNVNYFYCSDIYYHYTPIDNEGTIGKREDYAIQLIINPEDLTEEGYNVVEYKCS